MRVCIVGSRNFESYPILEHIVSTYFIEKRINVTEIVSGGARGADSLAEKFAFQYKIPFNLFVAQWEELGKSASVMRNKEMAKYSDIFIIFWDGFSKGTNNMINEVKKLRKTYVIYNFNGDKIYEYDESVERSRENLLNWMV